MKVAQEEDLVPGKRVMAVLVAVLVITAGGVLTAWLIADCRGKALGPEPVATPLEGMQRIPEDINGMELVLFDEPAPAYVQRARQEPRLRAYGWVSREAGVVHIPIERAMELYVRQRSRAERGQELPAPREQAQEETPR